MAEIYLTTCLLCERQFKTRKALEKHFHSKHAGHDLPATTVFSFNNKRAREVHPCLLKGRRDQYLDWLAQVVECINSAHNPRVPGEYF